SLALASWQGGPGGSSAELMSWDGPLRIEVPQPGLHNVQNAAMAVAAAITVGVPAAEAAAAIARFPGVARRLETVGEAAGVEVVDDFAHHPTALAATVAAARQRWPGRRLVVAFEPRSLTAARRTFHRAYLDALRGADVALLAPIHHRGRLADNEILDRTMLAEELKGLGVRCVTPDTLEESPEALLDLVVRGDVVVGCSSGSFAGFHRKLLELLAERDS
ncbi:MAG: cyanophycin synthetase, partial [Acidobacteriota bacterium]